MTSSKLGFVSAIALVAAIVTTPARATSTTCDTALSPADSTNGPFVSVCAGADLSVEVSSQTWASFFNKGTGASIGRAAELFIIPVVPLSLTAAVFCSDGAIKTSFGSSATGTEVDELAGCNKNALAVVGQAEAIMAD